MSSIPKSKIVRQPDLTCGSILNDVINWWYQEHENIKKKHKELLGTTNAIGVLVTPALDIRHVYANYIIRVHPNVRLSNSIARRLWLAQTTWTDYETLVKMAPVEQVSLIQLQGSDLFFARIAQGARVDGATLPSGFKVPRGKWIVDGDCIRRIDGEENPE